eukprot:COSAG04_NODE_999_length_8849_cov_3.214286_8_plen_66_part_00
MLLRMRRRGVRGKVRRAVRSEMCADNVWMRSAPDELTQTAICIIPRNTFPVISTSDDEFPIVTPT